MMTRSINLIALIDYRQVSDLADRDRLRGAAGVTTNNDFSSEIVLNLRAIWNHSQMCHRTFEEELIRTLEHEYVHAVGADDENKWQDVIENFIETEGERPAWEFENAGAWARR